MKPRKLYSDRGVEFQSVKMLEYFKVQDIIKKVVYSDDIHFGVVERANRTIKEKIYSYFNYMKDHRLVDIVDKIVKCLNNSVKRTTGIPPNHVTIRNFSKS